METIKRKIHLESSINRESGSENWGTLTATTFYIKVMLTQNIDDMGLFTDIDFVPKNKVNEKVDYSILVSKLNELDLTFPFMSVPTRYPINLSETEKVTLRVPSIGETSYYSTLNKRLSGTTDSKLEDLRTYKTSDPFRTNFNVGSETYDNYKDLSVIGVNRIISMNEPKIYVFDTVDDDKIGTSEQIHGIKYMDFYSDTQNQINTNTNIPYSTFMFISEGWNMTNTSLSALSKKNYLFGIISTPEIKNDIFIDRGAINVLGPHLRLAEIGNISELVRYGNGYYKINK